MVTQQLLFWEGIKTCCYVISHDSAIINNNKMNYSLSFNTLLYRSRIQQRGRGSHDLFITDTDLSI
jgi:hypothetical protein